MMLDPDPLHVELDVDASWAAGFDEGYEQGVRDSFPPRVATVLVATVMLVAGILIGWTSGVCA